MRVRVGPKELCLLEIFYLAKQYRAGVTKQNAPSGDPLRTGRINNDGNYEPGNCRWATRKEQGLNRRGNRFVTIGCETKTISQWAELMNLSQCLIHRRIALGWFLHR